MKKMSEVINQAFPPTKSAFAVHYNCTERTFRNWVRKLADKKMLSFSYDDFKAVRLLPLKMRVEIAQHLGI